MPIAVDKQTPTNVPLSTPATEESNKLPQQTTDNPLHSMEADTHPPVGQQDVASSLSSHDVSAQPTHLEQGAASLAEGSVAEHAEATQRLDTLLQANKPLGKEGINSILNMVAMHSDTNLVTPHEAENIQYAGNYLLKLDQDMATTVQLVDKFAAGDISEAEMTQLNGLLKTHKHNLAVLQTWLGEPGNGLTSQTALKMTELLSQHIADRHMDLADMMAMCVDGLPEREPISRGQSIQNGMVSANSMIHSLDNLHRYMPVKEQYHKHIATTREQIANLATRLQKLFNVERGPSEVSTEQPLSEQMASVAAYEDAEFDTSRKSSHARPASELAKTEAGKELIKRWDQMSASGSKEAYLPAHVKGMSQVEMLSLFTQYNMKKAPGYDKNDWTDFNFVHHQAQVHTLNRSNPGAWKKIENNVGFPCLGQEHTVTSTITPEGADKGTGACSGDRITQTDRVPNLATTQVSDSSGKVLFKGIRHGILTPYNLVGKNLSRLPREDIANMLAQAKGDSSEVAEMLEQSSAEDLINNIKKDKKLATRVANALRTAAANRMATRMVVDTAASDPSIVQRALKGETPTVRIDSISLVTPDLLRGKKPNKSERDMLNTQNAAWAAAQGEHEIEVLDPADNQLKKVTVKAEINPLNFGVNVAIAGPVGKLNLISKQMRKIMGWGFSMGMNEPALTTMLGDMQKADQLGGQTEAKLAELKVLQGALRNNLATARRSVRNQEEFLASQVTADRTAGVDAQASYRTALDVARKEEQTAAAELERVTKEIAVITDLGRQIKTMAKDRSYLADRHEPYKMVSRLALLSNKLGHKTAFNCKSGKDRTGQLDSEVKYLAARADILGRVPEPNQAPTPESQKAKTNFVLRGGSLEMQAYNTGLPGYKNALGSLKRQFEADAWPLYRGGSDYVSS